MTEKKTEIQDKKPDTVISDKLTKAIVAKDTVAKKKVLCRDFFIDEFLGGLHFSEKSNESSKCFSPSENEKMKRFEGVCTKVKIAMDTQFSKLRDEVKKDEAEFQKKAITGDRKAVRKLKSDISGILTSLNLLSEEFPSYYRTLEEAIFHELYGLAGLAAWANDYTEEYKNSSSAKLVGDYLYCLIKGKSVRQPQKIEKQRRDQLRQALLMAYPKQHESTGHNEVFLNRDDGAIIRSTLLSDKYTQKGGDTMVFRKYLLSDPKSLRFEVLAGYGTFPIKCCELFEIMVKIGFNVIFLGEVRSGKTTFLQTYQHYEDPTLEGTTVSTDEETDYSKITEGPLIQIVADETELMQMEKTLKRLDSNYIVMSEMRTPAEYKFYLGITNMGTRRCKCTIHDNDAVSFPRKMATEVVSNLGGDQQATISQIYSNVDFVFEMFEVPNDRSKKRLKGIVEFRYDRINDRCAAHRICRYDALTDSWQWNSDIGEDKRDVAIGFMDQYERMRSLLSEFERLSPIEGETTEYPAYYHGNTKGSDKP